MSTDHQWDTWTNIKQTQEFEGEDGKVYQAHLSSWSDSTDTADRTSFIHWIFLLRAAGIPTPWSPNDHKDAD